MRYKIYHNDQFIDSTFGTKILGNTLRQAAVVECTGLDDVFEKTNSIEHPWTKNPEVISVQTTRPRSLSAGDFILDEASNKLYLVAACGFREVTDEEHASFNFQPAL